MKGKLESLMKDRKKLIGIVIGVLAVIVIAVVCIFTVFSGNSKKTLTLLKNQFTLEYGEKISLDAKDYLKADTSKEVLDNAKVEVLGDKQFEVGKEYYAVGDYQVQISYEDEKVQAKVTIQDTTSPTLNVPTSIEIAKNTDLSKYDFISLISATDLSQMKDLQFDTSKVDMSKEGEYQANVSVEDNAGNKAEKTFTIKVVAEAKEDEKITTEVVKNEDGTTKVVVKKETTTSEDDKKDDDKSSSTSNNSTSGSNTSKPSTGGSSSTSKPSGSGSSSSGSSSSKPSTGGSSSTTKPSGSGSSSSGSSSSSKPSTGGSSSTNKPSGSGSSSNGGSSSSKPSEEKPHTHIFTSNTGKWFDTQAECEAYFDSKEKIWSDKLDNNEITYEEYTKNCPQGYEVLICTCGKRTVNLFYPN